MARRRTYNTVRTDYLEGKIAHYEAMRWYDAAEALRSLAHDIGAPIDEGAIAEDARKRRIYYTRANGPERMTDDGHQARTDHRSIGL